MADFKQLSEEDAHRFYIWAGGLVMACENAYYQYRIGMLDEDRWRVQRSIVQGTFSAPGVAQWWRSNPGIPDLSPEFVALVEEILGEEAEGTERPE